MLLVARQCIMCIIHIFTYNNVVQFYALQVLTHGEDSSTSAVDSQANGKSSRSTLCINPGRLAKGMYGGTFSDVMTMPFLENGKGQWPQQARVSIIKL